MRSLPFLCALGLAAACNSPLTPAGGDDTTTGPGDEWDTKLAARELDYNAALRIAALRLTGELPTLSEIKAVADAGADPGVQKGVYNLIIRSYLDGPRFPGMMIRFWRDTFKMGGSPLLDSAPVFAAQVTVEGRPYTELLTAATGTCPTYAGADQTFTPADCTNGVTTAAGILSNPGVQAQFFSNLAFRRVRWVQEIFACTAFPAELIGEPPEGAPTYLSPWAMNSIAGTDNGGTIDFHDVSAVICANCHTTMNHIAPLFANFDENGAMQPTIQVKTPLDGAPLALRTDWLPGTEPTAWRFGKPTPDLPSLGAAMAADPLIAQCAIARTWNWALGKGDIVDTLAVVPADTIKTQVAAFQADGMNLKNAIFAVYTADDFVRF